MAQVAPLRRGFRSARVPPLTPTLSPIILSMSISARSHTEPVGFTAVLELPSALLQCWPMMLVSRKGVAG